MLDRDVVHELARVASGTLTKDDRLEGLLEKIPLGLNDREVEDVGRQVDNFVELVNPSWDGYSRGVKYETRALQWLGYSSIDRGDLITAENIAAHLRELGGIRNRLGALALARAVAKA